MKKSVLTIVSILCVNLCLILCVGHFAYATKAKGKPAPAEKPKADVITYFSCDVQEPISDKPADKNKTVTVTVKFAVQNLDLFDGKADLIQYPESDEEQGMVSVTPDQIRNGKKAFSPKMGNLNGQGGDLRTDGNNLKLWGDGDGYQFTDLVVCGMPTTPTKSILKVMFAITAPLTAPLKLLNNLLSAKNQINSSNS